jgi:hypothetical protein
MVLGRACEQGDAQARGLVSCSEQPVGTRSGSTTGAWLALAPADTGHEAHRNKRDLREMPCVGDVLPFKASL